MCLERNGNELLIIREAPGAEGGVACAHTPPSIKRKSRRDSPIFASSQIYGTDNHSRPPLK